MDAWTGTEEIELIEHPFFLCKPFALKKRRIELLFVQDGKESTSRNLYQWINYLPKQDYRKYDIISLRDVLASYEHLNLY